MDGMAHDHSGHNHSAQDMGVVDHSAHDHSMHDMGGVVRLPDGSYTYTHGAFTGHVVPGAFFLLWGFWWAMTTYTAYVRCLAANTPFRTRGWRLLPFGPARLRQLPLEPYVKIVLPAVGILGELWLGHEAYRPLYRPDGMFSSDHLNDWQHSSMYLCFLASGVVDLLTFYLGAPAGTELAFLAISFLSEGVLLVFHLKGPRIEVLVHLILALQVFATVFALLGEMAAPGSILVASARPWLAMLQGVWWIHTAYIMYTGAPQWDPDYMGSGMFAPVPFVLHMLWIAAFLLALLLIIKAVAERRLGRPLSFDGKDGAQQCHTHLHARLPTDDVPDTSAVGGTLELSGLLPHKSHGYGGHNA